MSNGEFPVELGDQVHWKQSAVENGVAERAGTGEFAYRNVIAGVEALHVHCVGGCTVVLYPVWGDTMVSIPSREDR